MKGARLTSTSIWDDASAAHKSRSPHPVYTSRALHESISIEGLAFKLRKLKQVLAGTIDAWAQFEEGDITYFQATEQSEECERMKSALMAIRSIYSKMKKKLKEMERLILDVSVGLLY
jgi:hypothetical protein